jgi:type VI secretion system protein ImpJ
VSKHLPVVWSEGMLLSPQHLQQWDRYVHHLVGERFRATQPFEWGLTRLELDREAVRNGRLAVIEARGVFPDGTPFAVPEDDPAPAPRSVEGHFGAKQESILVHLGLPSARPGRPELGAASEPGTPMPRFAPESFEIADRNTGSDERAVTMARRNLVLLFPDEALADHDVVPIAEMVRTSDGSYSIRDSYVPPCLSIGASEALMRQLRAELEMLVAKSNTLGDMRRQRGGIADFSSTDTMSFGMLQAVNGSIPMLSHFVAQRRAHPEQAYLGLSALAGALCTFSPDQHAKDLPAYDHRGLAGTFGGLHSFLSRLLEIQAQSKAVRIDLEKMDGSRYVGRIQDPRLLEPASKLFLGVRAEVEEQKLVTELPEMVKIASLDKIDFLISRALRGVPVNFLRVPPAGLPVKASYVYFQLDSSSEAWETVKGAKNVAIFVPPEFPGLALELLGLRE